MSYSLELYFEPAVRRDRVLAHFGARRRFSMKNDDVVYEIETPASISLCAFAAPGNYFAAASSLQNLRSTIVGPAISASKPKRCYPTSVAVFGAAGSKILRSKAWGKDSYSREGFLSGWNFGNVFAARNALSPGHNVATMPADKLRATWEWNYHRAERQRRNPGLFVPGIVFFRIERRPSRVATWGEGMPICCPRSTTSWSGELFRRSALRPRALVRGSGSRSGRRLGRDQRPAQARLSRDTAADRRLGRQHSLDRSRCARKAVRGQNPRRRTDRGRSGVRDESDPRSF